MKKIIVFIVVIGLLMGHIPLSYAETGSLEFQDRESGYRLTVNHPERGEVVYYQPSMWINGQAAFCLEMYVSAYPEETYTSHGRLDYISEEVHRDLELIVYLSWTLSPRRYEDYFITMLLVWERLGYSWPDKIGSWNNPTGLKYYKYPERKAEIMTLVEQYKAVSSIQGKHYQVRLGETITIDDPSGAVLAMLEAEGPLHHTSYVKQGQTIQLTGLSVGTDEYVFNKYREEDIGATLYWTNPKDYQDVATFAITAPDTTRFQVTVEEGTGDLIVTKRGFGNKLLPGATFRLYTAAGASVGRRTSDDNGQLRFDGLTYGDYLLREETAPTGYVKPATDLPITIDRFAVTKEIVNQPIQVEIYKRDEAGNPLAGARLELIDSLGLLVRSWLSTTSPEVFDELPVGRYTIRERLAPPGYLLSQNLPIEVKNTADVQSFSMINRLGRGSFELTKTDVSTAQPLPNTTITIYKEDGTEVQSKVTSDTGVALFENLPIGKYYFVETNAPVGYHLNTAHHPFEIKTNREIVKATMTNQLIQGNPQVKKVDLETNEPLAGAVISLYTMSGRLLQTVTTGENGIGEFEAIDYGKYYLVEETAPTGYVKTEEMHLFEVIEQDELIEIIIPNQRIQGTPTIQKLDFSTSQPLPNTIIELYSDQDELLETKTTDENGQASFAILPYGRYYFLEKQAPVGYVLNPNKHWFDITTHGQVIQSDMTNELLQGTPVLRKQDGVTKEPLANAVIELYSAQDVLLETVTTTESGEARFTEIPYGSYYFLEKTAPVGYVLNIIKHPFEVTTDGEIVIVTMDNELIHGSVEVTKTDAKTAEPLAEAEIGLFHSDGTLIASETSDESGIVRFDEIPFGSYYIQEVSPPEGYVLNESKYPVEIVTNQAVISVNLPNQKIYATPELTKRDFSTAEPLPNTVIEVYTEAGELLETKTTDQAGIATFTPLEYGKYYFLEKDAPEGYVLNPYKHFFEIRQDGVIVKATMTNELIEGTVVLYKQDEGSKQALAGAEIELYKESGQLVETKTTNELGEVVFEGITYGQYYLKEKTPPVGYVLNNEPHNVSIELDGQVASVTMDNRQIVGTPKLVKRSATTEELLAGAVIELYDGNDQLLETVTTSETGEAVFQPVVYGSYYFIEKQAPQGHVRIRDKQAFTISQDGVTVTLELANEPIIGTPIVRKQDAETKRAIEGTLISLYSEEGELLETIRTNASGEAVFSPVIHGNYFVQEKQASLGYALNEDQHPFAIAHDGEIVQIVIDNHQIEGQPVVIKYSDSDEPLAGAVIGLYNTDEQLLEEVTTRDDGRAVFSPVSFGQYFYLEHDPPEGYVRNTEEHWFEIRHDGDTVATTLINQPIRGIATLRKQARDTAEPLAGAVIELYDSTHQLLDTKETDDTGHVVFEGLVYGSYYFVEKIPPEGFVKTEEQYPLEINMDGQVGMVLLENKPIESEVVITKIGADTKKPLAGVGFELRQGEVVVDSYITDENGQIIKTLPFGEYELVETRPLRNYLPLSEPTAISVTEDGEVIEILLTNEARNPVLPKTGLGQSRGLFLIGFGLLGTAGYLIQQKKSREGTRR